MCSHASVNSSDGESCSRARASRNSSCSLDAYPVWQCSHPESRLLGLWKQKPDERPTHLGGRIPGDGQQEGRNSVGTRRPCSGTEHPWDVHRHGAGSLNLARCVSGRTYLQNVKKSSTLTGETGVNGVAILLAEQLGWALRRQSEADVGIDGQIEVNAEDDPTGRLIGVQVKAGPSFFAKQTPDGSAWIFRENTQKHRDYWLNYQLPVILALYDASSHVAYWQHITPETAKITGRGFKVLVPKLQRIDEDAEEALVALAGRLPANGLQELLLQLPYACAARLHLLDLHAPSLTRRLARELVAGRTAGGQSARRLLNEALSARDDWPHAAFVLLGEYALEYGDAATAAEFFVHADASADEGQRGRWAAFAGSLLSSSDPVRARDLFTAACGQPGGRLLGLLGLAGLDHGAQLSPVPIPEAVTAAAEEADQDPAVQRFLADQAQRAGDLGRALELHEKAFALAPDNPAQQLAVADMLLRQPSTRSAADLKRDLRRAAKLASAVRGAKRRWQGDSVPAARLLQSALILAGDTERAIRVATRQPDGEATEAEAASPSLAAPVAKIAYEQGRLELAEALATVVDQGDDQTASALLAAVREKAAGGDSQEQRWREALRHATDSGPQLVILDELAALGCWPLPELDKLKDEGQLRPGIYDVIHARALETQGETNAAQALLRRHLRTSSLAAERYVSLLAADEKFDEAITVCDQAANRFGDSRHLLQALDVLDKASRTDQLLARAADLLSRAGIPYSLRHHVRGKILHLHEQRRDWVAAESLASAGLEEVAAMLDEIRDGKADPLLPTDSRGHLEALRHAYAWSVVRFQFNQGHTDLAIETFDSLAPEITDAHEASLWLDLHRLHPWSPDATRRAFELTEHLALPEQLIGRILFTLLQSTEADTTAAALPDDTTDEVRDVAAQDLDRTAIPPALHQQITDGWHAHLERRAASEGASPDSGFMSEQELRDREQSHVARQILANAGIWQGRLHVGAAAQAAETPYLLALAERRARILPIADPDPAVYSSEVQAARASLGEAVSIETTSLFVLAALLDQWSAVFPEFSNVLLAEPSAHDILMSHVAARALGGDVRYFGIDPATGAATSTDLDEETLRRIRRHTNAVHTVVQECSTVHLADLRALGDGAPQDINGPWPWLSAIAVAVERRIAFYSDDAWLRALARAGGVPTFGTLALLEALGAGHPAAPDPGMILAFLFAHHSVDLPDVDGLVRNALNAGDTTSEPVLINIARPNFWKNHNVDFADTVVSIVGPAYRTDPETLGQLTEAITHGATAAFADTALTAAVVVAAILARCTSVTRDAADVVVPIVCAVAAQHGIDPTPRIREVLINTLTDPTSTIQLTTGAAAQVVDHALRLPTGPSD